MKIIKEGIKPEERHPWWEGQEFQCDTCNVIVSLESSDKSKISGLSYGGNILTTCPVCTNSQWFRLYSTWWRVAWRRFSSWMKEDVE